VGRVAAVRPLGFGFKACRCRTPQVAIEQTGQPIGLSSIAVTYAVAIPVRLILVLLWAVSAPIVDGAVNRPIVILLGDAVSPLVPLSAEVTGVALVVATIAAVCASMITQRS
jgi:hypothetical protein